MNFNLIKKAPSMLGKALKKSLGYSVAIGSVFGTFNAAQAVDLTANDIWADGIATAAGTITDPTNNMAVDLKGFTLSMVTAGDG